MLDGLSDYFWSACEMFRRHVLPSLQ